MATLEILAAELTKEVSGIKAEFRVRHAILMRLDTGQTAVLTELHAMHIQMARMLDRLEQHE